MDMYVKSSCRQDLKVDDEGYVHVVFNEQVVETETPSRLHYATNKTGSWTREIAFSFDYGPNDDAGWYPSLCLDTNNVPHIACQYIRKPLGILLTLELKKHLPVIADK